MAIGILAAVLLAAGLIPPYIEIWKHRGEVVGISYMFLSIDCLGGIFSLLSLFAQRGPFDIIAGVQFSVLILLEVIIMIFGAVWKLRVHLRGKKEQDVEKLKVDVVVIHGKSTVCERTEEHECDHSDHEGSSLDLEKEEKKGEVEL